MAQRQQLLDQPAGKTHHPRVDHLDADRLDPFEADLDRRQAQIIDRAILKPGRAGCQVMAERHHRGKGDRAAGVPGAMQLLDGDLARDQQAPTPVG